jgi:anaerobic selenocysteine-containing dehydrogenase
MPGTDGALALAMMHVLIAHDLVDRDYVARTRPDTTRSRRGAAHGRRSAAAQTAASTLRKITALAREYGTTRPAAIRLNYGMQRVAGGGNAVRAVACLPALVGAWRDPAGGALLSSSGTYPVDHHALERPI